VTSQHDQAQPAPDHQGQAACRFDIPGTGWVVKIITLASEGTSPDKAGAWWLATYQGQVVCQVRLVTELVTHLPEAVAQELFDQVREFCTTGSNHHA